MKKTVLRIKGKNVEGVLIEKTYCLKSFEDLLDRARKDAETDQEVLDLWTIFNRTNKGDFPTVEKPLFVNMARFISRSKTVVSGNTSSCCNKVKMPSQINSSNAEASGDNDVYYDYDSDIEDYLTTIEDKEERARLESKAYESGWSTCPFDQIWEQTETELRLKYETFKVGSKLKAIREAARTILEGEKDIEQLTPPATLSTGKIRGRLSLISTPENKKPAKFRFGRKDYFVPSGKAWDWVQNVILQNGFEGHPIETDSPSDYFKRDTRAFFTDLIKCVENKQYYIQTK